MLLKLFGGSTIKGLAGMAPQMTIIVDHYSTYPVLIFMPMLSIMAFHGEKIFLIPPQRMIETTYGMRYSRST